MVFLRSSFAMSHQPNFFIIGAPKSATTSMDYYLSQHPEVFMCPIVDTWHFIPDMTMAAAWNVKDRAEYEKLFEPATDTKIIGEKSVFYLTSPGAAREIHDYNPNALLLAILRHPVDVMFSLHKQFVGTGNEDIYNFMDALSAEPDRAQGKRIPSSAHLPEGLQYRHVVRFADQLRRYFETFGREHVLVLLYDDVRNDVNASYRQVLNFLHVDADFVPDFEPKNVTAEKNLRNLNIRRLIKHNMIARFVARRIPRQFRGAVGNRLEQLNRRHKVDPHARISSDLRRILTEELKPGIIELGELIERDLSGWIKIAED